MTEEQKESRQRKPCVVCQKEKAFFSLAKEFEKCFSCAMAYRDEMHEKFVACLSPEQLALLEVYNKAREEFTSMVILD